MDLCTAMDKMYIFLSNGLLLCLLKHCSPLIFSPESSFLDFPGAYLFDLICYWCATSHDLDFLTLDVCPSEFFSVAAINTLGL